MFPYFKAPSLAQVAIVRAALLVLLLSGCENPEDIVSISKNGGTSHHAGNDCTKAGCHDAGEQIVFSYAGTAFENNLNTNDPLSNKPLVNGKIVVATVTTDGGGNDTAIASIDKTIEIDASGNFYTTEPLTINYPTQRPCLQPAGDTVTYCMPNSNISGVTTQGFSGFSCSNTDCHLNRRINPDINASQF